MKELIIHLNYLDKSVLALEASCTGRRITYSAILSIRGDPDTDRLRTAILSTARAHQELMTTVAGGPLRHYRKVHEEFVGEPLEVQDLAAIYAGQDSPQASLTSLYEERIHEWINRPLDTRRSFPFRILLLKKGASDYALVFTFHHSVVDAVRSLSLVDDVICRYHNKLSSTSLVPGVVKRDGDELLQAAKAERARTKHFYRDMFSNLLYYVFISPLLRPARIYHDRSARSGVVRFCSAKVSPEKFLELKAKSKLVGATVNDLGMAVCYRSIDRWNRQHGKRTRKISLTIPVNVGSPDLNGILSNQLSFISFSTSAADRRDSTQLLRKVSAKRAYMLKERKGHLYSTVYLAAAFSLLPLAAMQVLYKYVLLPLYADTVICTNPGILKVGDCGEGPVTQNGFRVVDLEAVPFAFPAMGMIIAVATFHGSLGIYIGYDTSRFSREKAEEFLSLCMDELANYQVNLEQAWLAAGEQSNYSPQLVSGLSGVGKART